MTGDVHDPRAWALGGVAGHAGLFSTASDLSRFARAMLGRGALDGHRIFSRATADAVLHASARVARRTHARVGRRQRVREEQAGDVLRALVRSRRLHGDRALGRPRSRSVRALLEQPRAPRRQRTGEPAGRRDRRARGSAVRGRDGARRAARRAIRAPPRRARRPRHEHVGARRATGPRDRRVPSTREANVKLAALFSPEHGLSARSRQRDRRLAITAACPSTASTATASRRRPTALAGLDALVFDLQDAGVRFYTYASTMRRAMRVAADAKLRFVVLDRPNPLDGVDVQGPVFSGASTFVSHARSPCGTG